MAHLHLNELSLICDMWLNKISYLLTYLLTYLQFAVNVNLNRISLY